ncbi:MAG TPA: DNA (cytosine-5-)-methyltransferase, partial [Leptospiraceae bacterium]|nr:DNA (cytosine-5-)-methyltransferase [Leptospiraceae bacterium]
MGKIHINLPENLHKILRAKSKTTDITIQDLTVNALQLALQNDRPFISISNAIQNKKKNYTFKFADLFAGIGGFRIAFEKAGGLCVFTSEWDKYCQKTYYENFGEIPYGDITSINPEELPDHDLLVAGFPCQPFSIAGVSKKNSLGKDHGFKDKTQGTLFFNVANILEIKRPKAFLLENVKNLISHDKGKTFSIIKETLKELKYHFYYKVIDAKGFVPQHRERIYIAGFNQDFFENVDFKFPESPKTHLTIGALLEKNPDKKYILTDHLWDYLQNYAEKHKKLGNGFGFGLVKEDSTTRTLSARYYKDG